MKKPDVTIATQIANVLENDSRIDARDVMIEVTDGAVRLSGNVSSIRARSAAYDVAYMIDGVNKVTNDLKLSYQDAIDDESLEEHARSMLKSNPDIDASDIRVSARDGNVALTGTVGSYYERLLCESDVACIIGVLDVDNAITVVISEDITDETIGEDICDAFEAIRSITQSNISVHVEDGVVTLTGTVNSYIEQREARNLAAYTNGVVGVNDRMVIV